MGLHIRKKRSVIEQQARDAAYSALVSKPTELAITNYLRSNFSSGSGGSFNPTFEDVATARYVLGLVEGTSTQFKVSKFREVMNAWTGGDSEEYLNLVGELETLLTEQGRRS